MTTYIRRAPHANRFTTIDNSVIQDDRLSFKARGLHHLILSLPPTTKISLRRLAGKSQKDGIDSVKSAMKELQSHGYAWLHHFRDEHGRFEGHEWVVFELPQAENPLLDEAAPSKGLTAISPKVENPLLDEPEVGFPEVENPQVANPEVENPHIYKMYIDINKTEDTNKTEKEIRTDPLFSPDQNPIAPEPSEPAQPPLPHTPPPNPTLPVKTGSALEDLASSAAPVVHLYQSDYVEGRVAEQKLKEEWMAAGKSPDRDFIQFHLRSFGVEFRVYDSTTRKWVWNPEFIEFGKRQYFRNTFAGKTGAGVPATAAEVSDGTMVKYFGGKAQAQDWPTFEGIAVDYLSQQREKENLQAERMKAESEYSFAIESPVVASVQQVEVTEPVEVDINPISNKPYTPDEQAMLRLYPDRAMDMIRAKYQRRKEREAIARLEAERRAQWVSA